MGNPQNNDVTSFFDSGMSQAEPSIAEPFVSNSITYFGTFNEATFQVSLESGGFKSVRGSVLVTRKSIPFIPKIGLILIKDNIKFRVELIQDELTTYTITLVDTSK